MTDQTDDTLWSLFQHGLEISAHFGAAYEPLAMHACDENGVSYKEHAPEEITEL